MSKVILHTYIDSLRMDDDREINHHGRTVKVGLAFFISLATKMTFFRLASSKTPK